jgi:hypothetical protein
MERPLRLLVVIFLLQPCPCTSPDASPLFQSCARALFGFLLVRAAPTARRFPTPWYSPVIPLVLPAPWPFPSYSLRVCSAHPWPTVVCAAASSLCLVLARSRFGASAVVCSLSAPAPARCAPSSASFVFPMARPALLLPAGVCRWTVSFLRAVVVCNSRTARGAFPRRPQLDLVFSFLRARIRRRVLLFGGRARPALLPHPCSSVRGTHVEAPYARPRRSPSSPCARIPPSYARSHVYSFLAVVPAHVELSCRALCARAARSFFVCRAHEFYLLATACRAPAPSSLLSQARWPQLS